MYIISFLLKSIVVQFFL